MSPSLRKKRGGGKTVAVLDVESGSVGASLVRISPSHKPHLFAQKRDFVSPRTHPSGAKLFSEIERATESQLRHLGTVGARLRAHGNMEDAGRVTHVAVFLHAPWMSLNFSSGRAKTDASSEVLTALRDTVSATFGEVPISFHAFTTSVPPIFHGLFGRPQSALTCVVTGEVTEISLLRQGVLEGHATIPSGFNMLLRTLRTHAGLSHEEALSALSLARRTENNTWEEALVSGAKQFIAHMGESVFSLMPAPEVQQIFVLAPHASSEWLARMLTRDASLHDLFAPGSAVRAISTAQALPYFATHPRAPDASLLFESLFVDTRFAD